MEKRGVRRGQRQGKVATTTAYRKRVGEKPTAAVKSHSHSKKSDIALEECEEEEGHRYAE